MRLGHRRSFVLLLLMAAPLAGAQEQPDRLTINGYTSFEFEKRLEKAGRGDPNASFDADGFDLVLNVHATERVRAALDLGWEHGAATENLRGNVVMEYGFVEYAFSDLVKLRAGKMFTPFGIFNEIHTAKIAFVTVKEASSLNRNDRIVAGGFPLYPRWGAGLALHGDGQIRERDFSYDVLVANGDQPTTPNALGVVSNPFDKDDNTFKSVATRFRYEATEKLRVGYSFYFDKRTDPVFDRLVSHGLEAEFALRRFRVQSEVGFGGRRPRAGGPSVRELGFYVQPSFDFGNGITPYLRIDLFDPNTDTAGDHGFDVVFGVNLEVAKNVHVKLEDNYVRGGVASSLAMVPGRDSNEIKLAVVLGF